MTEERLEMLVWEEIDGTITSEERAELEAELRSRPEARDLQRHVLSVSQLLGRVVEFESPPEMRRSVSDAVASSSSLFGQVAHFRPAPTLRFGYLAAGLLIGALGTYLVSSTLDVGAPIDTTQLQGAMVATVGGLEIPLASLGGSMLLSRHGDLVVADINLAHAGDVSVLFESDDGPVELRIWEQMSGGKSSVRLGGSRIDFTVSGAEHLRAAFLVKGELRRTLVVRVLARGGLVAQEEVDLERLPEGSGVEEQLF